MATSMSVHTATLHSPPGGGESPFKKQRTDESHAESTEVEKQQASSSSSFCPPSQPPLPNLERLAKPVPPELQSDYDPSSYSAELPKSTSILNYRHGLFLAPMVRIGALPTRLLSLEYGADLVWGPEIVDRAIMGSERIVDAKTGTIHYMKSAKPVFSTHPVERPYVIFQLGSATPAWAYETVKMVTEHDDVAGVDLNCGCPKNFSTTGGMGAGLLPRPDLLCDILRAMRRAAPPHVAVTCKLRLLPTTEATKALVRQIVQTGAVDAITIHCRTKEMRPREPALLDRISEVVDTVREESGGRIPVCHNGDAWGWQEAQDIMKRSSVTSSMLARGPEKNPSCFRPGPMADIAKEVVPKWIKYAVMTDNHVGNTKYCLQVLDWPTSKGVSKAQIGKLKDEANRAKSNEEMCEMSYYKGQIDAGKCKSEWQTYVLGALEEVLKQRKDKSAKDESDGAARQTLQGAVGRGDENEEAVVNGHTTVELKGVFESEVGGNDAAPTQSTIGQ